MRSVPLFLVIILAAQVLGNRRGGSKHDWMKPFGRSNNKHYRRNYNDDDRPMDFSPNWDDDDDDDDRPVFSHNWYDDDDDDDDDYNDFQYNQYNRYNFRRRAMEFSGKTFTQMLAAAP
ncbi:unnamed protein product [Nippostrongylus brasiliensis]|uniref:Venom peptide n=1 Tax=Nippostrongylus brasiliensis TaxID=27835 RepID=A0A0N4XLG3_NIPBR|nr:hypothetical protein Q1695_015972 [Nippostrongylus brasiliensis]WKY02358.1 hypothetical protein Q1695_015977 [Nippostrongylus brasiliensis]VDL66954.1 unnamed protein product [Nippostrongylus brasiliensis]